MKVKQCSEEVTVTINPILYFGLQQLRNLHIQVKVMQFCRSLLLYFLVCVCAASNPRNAKSSDNLIHLEHLDSLNRNIRFQMKPHGGLGGFEPGDIAPAFRVQTLDGVFVYPPQNESRSALIVHAFTNKSAFLECLWTWNESLSDLLEHLPPGAQVLFLSLDETAARDAVWMREQVYRATFHRYTVHRH